MKVCSCVVSQQTLKPYTAVTDLLKKKQMKIDLKYKFC